MCMTVCSLIQLVLKMVTDACNLAYDGLTSTCRKLYNLVYDGLTSMAPKPYTDVDGNDGNASIAAGETVVLLVVSPASAAQPINVQTSPMCAGTETLRILREPGIAT